MLIKPISNTAAEVMKGATRKLVPLTEFKGPTLQLTQHAKNMIWQYEKLIHRELKMIEELEIEKSALGLTPTEIARIESKIQKLIASIAEDKERIRDIKIDNYKGQLLDTNV